MEKITILRQFLAQIFCAGWNKSFIVKMAYGDKKFIL